MSMVLLSTILGVFFAITGWHKLTVTSRAEALHCTLRDNGLPCSTFWCRWVAGWELAAGIAASLGLLWWALGVFFVAQLAMIPIIAILGVAITCEACEKVDAYEPLNAADWVDDLLYLPEVLMLVMALAVVLA